MAETPGDYPVDDGGDDAAVTGTPAGDADHRAACFRRVDDHEYWESPPLDDEDEEPAPEQTADD